jgi:hypothetical protein
MTSLDALSNIQLNTVHEATPSEVDTIHRPDQIFTAGYLDTPIQYVTDQRFIPSTVTTELASLPDALQRDFVSAVEININTEDRQGFPINMYSPVWDRNRYNKVIGSRTGFNHF